MTSPYKNMAATALRMIAEKGRSIEVLSPGSEQVYDPLTDEFTAGVDTSVTVKGVFTQFSTKDIDGELVLRTDKKVLIAAASLPRAPSNEDKIKDGEEIYRVINTEITKPGDTALLYMAQVRR